MGDLELLQPNSNKSLTQAIGEWFSNFSESFNAIKIGRIEGVDFEKQTVDVQILHKKVNQVFKTRELKDYPMLKSVPFIVLGGGGGSLTFPISVGDNCLLLFCDYEIDRWWDTGESLPANFERRHDISDAFAIVGVHSMVDLLQGYSRYVQLKYSDESKITVGNEITLDNAEVVATGNLTANGTVTCAQVLPNNGYSGVVTVGNQLLSFANGILVSVE